MAVDTRVEAVAAARVAARVSPAFVLGAMVALSFVARLAFAWSRATPNRYPDEYLYAELSRSFASGGLPLVRGHLTNFPAVLMPLLTAPAWLFHDVGTSFRIIQASETLCMSLAAVPAYLLARRLRLGTNASLGVAALTLAVPNFLASAYVVASPFAYPLSILVTYAGVAALERPSRRAQLLLVGLFVIAALLRTQFMVTPFAFLGAAAIVGLRERRLRRVLFEQRVVLALLALAVAALGVIGLGYYSDALHLGVTGSLPRALAFNVLVIAFASGWVIVPGALVALGLGILRPLDRAELIFCSFAVTRVVGMFVEAALYGPQAHERYVAYVTPLVAIAFALYVRRGFPRRVLHAGVAAALLILALEWPLTTVAKAGVANSPVLLAVSWLGAHRSAGNTSLLLLDVMLLGTVMLLVLVRFRRAAACFAVVFAVWLGLATWAAAARFDQMNTTEIRNVQLPRNPSWVDARGLHDVALVQAYGGSRTDAFDQLFWNRSVNRVLLLPAADRIDAFAEPKLSVGGDGSLRANGQAVDRPLLVDEARSTVALIGGRLVASSLDYDLWVPRGGQLRLGTYFAGRLRDGSLLPISVAEVWHQRSRFVGTVRIVLSVPSQSDAAIVSLPDQHAAQIRIAPGASHALFFTACSRGPWKAAFQVERGTVRATMPRLVPHAHRLRCRRD
jgi:hypothetical protein